MPELISYLGQLVQGEVRQPDTLGLPPYRKRKILLGGRASDRVAEHVGPQHRSTLETSPNPRTELTWPRGIRHNVGGAALERQEHPRRVARQREHDRRHGLAPPVLAQSIEKLESLEVTGSEDEIGDGCAQVFDRFGEICSLEGYVAVITHESRDTPPFGHRTTEQQNRLPAPLTHRLAGARVRVAPECRRPRHGQVYRRPTMATLAINVADRERGEAAH